ncbi:hypothetical protein Goklo_013781, partial [Gossypium klotzschianum]|nr:hypothetical protein [Gossypium klotzschianum]
MSEKRKLSDWILDLGAIDRITGNEILFESLKSCYKNSAFTSNGEDRVVVGTLDLNQCLWLPEEIAGTKPE